ncbi:MAG: hypothetical protein G8345_03605, partial [Magnetococcales bacterium]|nr:hypothetical protein [Magnetococcales bacterium]
MNILVTLKGEHYELPHHAYAVLAEIHWPSKKIVRSLKIPAASFRHDGAFMAPLAGGVCCHGDRVFMAMWNFIVEIDYDTFEIVNAVSNPWMADLHGLATDGGYLYVVSTAVTSLLALNLKDLSLAWQWGPEEPILGQGASWWQRWSSSCGNEFRYIHKSRSCHYRHHLNDVRHRDGFLYLTTLKWLQQEGGAVIRLNPVNRQAEFLIPPGLIFGPHDGEWTQQGWLFTESAKNGVVWQREDGSLNRMPLSPAPAFVRGLCAMEEGYLVGFTRRRQSATPSWIVEFSEDFGREISRLDV